ncbi:hypothetical protein GCM10023096_01060 [Nonomuraea ferruginea]
MPQIKANLSTEPEPLPLREEAERCAAVDAGRRCVLPATHPGAHVYPPTDTSPRS